jgi:hypothetical protein
MNGTIAAAIMQINPAEMKALIELLVSVRTNPAAQAAKAAPIW